MSSHWITPDIAGLIETTSGNVGGGGAAHGGATSTANVGTFEVPLGTVLHRRRFPEPLAVDVRSMHGYAPGDPYTIYGAGNPYMDFMITDYED